MKWAATAGAIVLAIAPALGAQQPAPAPAAGAASPGMVTLRGCVTPGAEKNAFVLTGTREVTPGTSALPASAHGRRVIFWLDDERALAPHAGKLVEVRGALGKIEESEAELKAGTRKDGGLIVEFEGPGKDVVASAGTLDKPVGTSGVKTPSNDDVKAFLVHVRVNDVRTIETTCR
jgi:hypothetical protein